MLRVGKIAATHGLSGNLVLMHEVGSDSWLKNGAALFVALRKGSRIPFFVSQVHVVSHKEYHIRFEDVDSLEEAKTLVGREVFVESALIESSKADTPLRYIGLKMVDKTLGSLGEIADVYKAGAQWLAQVTVDEREVLVPLVDAFILDVNVRNRFIRVDLPEGLVDL